MARPDSPRRRAIVRARRLAWLQALAFVAFLIFAPALVELVTR